MEEKQNPLEESKAGETEKVEVPTTDSKEPVNEHEAPKVAPLFWENRKYIKRSFCFDFYSKQISGNFFEMYNNRFDIDGLCDDKEYQSMEQLIQMSGWDNHKKDEFVSKINKILNFTV